MQSSRVLRLRTVFLSFALGLFLVHAWLILSMYLFELINLLIVTRVEVKNSISDIQYKG